MSVGKTRFRTYTYTKFPSPLIPYDCRVGHPSHGHWRFRNIIILSSSLKLIITLLLLLLRSVYIRACAHSPNRWGKKRAAVAGPRSCGSCSRNRTATGVATECMPDRYKYIIIIYIVPRYMYYDNIIIYC